MAGMTTNAEMLEQAQAQQVAREELAEWAELARRVTESRDPLIRRVLRAGLPKSEVRRFTGLARTTIDRIADHVD